MSKLFSFPAQTVRKILSGTAMNAPLIRWHRVCDCLGRFLPLRHRHILTSAGDLRLRYRLPALIIAGCFILSVGFSALGTVMYQAGGQLPEKPSRVAEIEQPVSESAKSQDRTKGVPLLSNIVRAGESERAEAKSKISQEPVLDEKIFKIGKGDTLAAILQKGGLNASSSYKAVQAIEEQYDPRSLKPEQEIHFLFLSQKGKDPALSEIRMVVDPLQTVVVYAGRNGDFRSALEEKEVETNLYAAKSQIETSLYGSAVRDGIPVPVVADAIHIFSWDVDFQRDIRHGDALEVLYEQLETPEGAKIKTGHVLYARLNVNGQDIAVYRYETKEGDVDYFTGEGVSVRKALMKTPIDGARLSSGYGMRKHPVLGYSKMHKGVDFAAARGTPIYAAGDGTVEKAGVWSSYGNYVRIRHNASLKTAYAHLKGFAKGVSAGARVKQGQVIGYVGTTGRSTGPHLHYEVMQNGRQVNPRTLDMPRGETLEGEDLKRFLASADKIRRQYASLSGKVKYAQR